MMKHHLEDEGHKVGVAWARRLKKQGRKQKKSMISINGQSATNSRPTQTLRRTIAIQVSGIA